MLQRAGERDGARERWAIGAPYADEPVATVTIAPGARSACRRAAGSLTRRRPAAGRSGGWRPRPWPRPGRAALPVAAVVVARAAPAGRAGRARADRAPAGRGAGQREPGGHRRGHRRRPARGRADQPGRHAVLVEAQADGSYRARLRDVPAAESALFAEALDEVLAPLSQPRYVIPG